MKLGPHEIVAPDHRRQRAAVIGDGEEVRSVGKAEMVAVDEIGMGTRSEPGEQRMRRPRLELVPPHMRDLERGIARFDRHHLAGDPAEARDRLELAAAIRHQLHADADAEKRAGASDHRLAQRRFEAGNGGEHRAGNRQRRRRPAGRRDRRRQPLRARSSPRFARRSRSRPPRARRLSPPSADCPSRNR